MTLQTVKNFGRGYGLVLLHLTPRLEIDRPEQTIKRFQYRHESASHSNRQGKGQIRVAIAHTMDAVMKQKLLMKRVKCAVEVINNPVNIHGKRPCRGVSVGHPCGNRAKNAGRLAVRPSVK